MRKQGPITRCRISALVASVAAAAVMAGVAWPDRSGGEKVSEPQMAIMHGVDRWSSDTLRDWVSYADQLSVISVTAERELPPPEVGTSGGYTGRETTISIERTLWRRPQAPRAAGSVVVTDFGWLETEGVRREATIEGGVRLDVGQRYLAPLVLTDEGEWAMFSPRAVLPLQQERTTSRVDAGTPSPAVRGLASKSAEQAGQTLRDTEPFAAAVANGRLGPQARWQAAEAAAPTP